MLLIKRFSLTLLAIASLFASSALKSQNALNFDGTNDYVQTSFGGVLGSANRTFEAWVNVDPSASGNVAILDYGLNAVGSRNTFNVSGNNQLSFISGGTNANIGTANNAVPSGQWTHVAFVLNNGTGFLYVNGVQEGTGSLSTVNTPSGNSNMIIGERVSGGTIPFKGSIDEVRVWNYARTASQIANDMGNEFCSIPTGLVAYYKFNEGTAGGSNSGITSAPDVSGNGHNGTLNNFALSGSTSNWVTGISLSSTLVTSTVNLIACDSLVSPSGNYTWYSAGQYFDTIQTATGCDSAMTINLTVGSATSTELTIVECTEYTSPSGNYTWTTSGIYQDTIQNINGCDSILSINLTLNSTYNSISVVTCDEYTSPSGNYTWYVTGLYQDTLINAGGCDSILTIDLTISGTTVQSSIEESACVNYTSPSGNQTWTTSGIYSDTLTSASGCDSILSIDLTINTVDILVTKTGNTLTSAATFATFQWINCNDNEAIPDVTTSSFIPSTTGNYAVVVNQNGCTDTSDCFNVVIVGIEDVESSMKVELFPNPTAGNVTLDLSRVYQNVTVRVMNAEGKKVSSINTTNASLLTLDIQQPAGLYIVQIYADEHYHSFRVMKAE